MKDNASVSGATLIAAERQRQIEVEGWSIEHDREHGANRLGWAAAAYETNQGHLWPFDSGTSFKPKNPLRDLIRAGALYQAAADVADPNSYWSQARYERYRNDCAEKIDALLAEARAILEPMSEQAGDQ